VGSLSYCQISKNYRIPRVSIPISPILIEIFPWTHGPEVSLGRVFVAVASSADAVPSFLYEINKCGYFIIALL